MPRCCPAPPSPSLQRLCLLRYLHYLESACAAYIQLQLADCPLLRPAAARILPALKQQLDSGLTANISGAVREELLEILFSGQFPSAAHRKSYHEDVRGLPDEPGSHEDRARHQE